MVGSINRPCILPVGVMPSFLLCPLSRLNFISVLFFFQEPFVFLFYVLIPHNWLKPWVCTPSLFGRRCCCYNEKLRLDVGCDNCTTGSRTAGLLFLSPLSRLAEEQLGFVDFPSGRKSTVLATPVIPSKCFFFHMYAARAATNS